MSKQKDISQRKAQLTPAKQALLAKLRRGEHKTELGVIGQRPKQDTAPLSFAQQRLWFIEQLAPDTPAYNIPVAIRLTGSLNIAALEQSLNEIIRRHEALRTTFATVDGLPVQAIAPQLTLTLAIINLRDILKARMETEVLRLATQETLQPFNLSQGPLLRATLLHLGEKEHVMLLTMHHIISDGWSMGILVREMAILYEAFSHGKRSPLPELPIQYADFAVWQRQWLQGEVLQTQLSYWKQQLGGDLPVLELPTDYPRPAIQTFQGARHSFLLSKSLSEALTVLSQQEDVTLFMTLLAGFQTLLYRYTRQEDICVGSPIANRNRSEIEGLIGFFINTQVLRTDLGGNPTFRELLKRVRAVTLGAYAHQDLPFEKLVEELQPERNLSHTPLFQVLFVLQNTPMPTLELPGLTLNPLELDSETAKFELTLSMVETEQGLMGTLDYNAKLFDSTTIARMTEHFQNLLTGIVANPEQPLSNLPLLTAAEHDQLLVEWNQTQVDYQQDVCIHQLFEAQVERTPEAVAVEFADEWLSYKQLNAIANQVAHTLAAKGIGKGTYVPVLMDKSIELVVALLAIMKAGSTYVPLDIDWPIDRLKQVLEELNSEVILVNQAPPYQEEVLGRTLLVIDRLTPTDSTPNLNLPIDLGEPIYAIYTSGSTGKPKAAVVPHRGITNRFLWMNDFFGRESAGATLQTTRHVFDSAVWELFWPLINGGKMVIPPLDLKINADDLTTLIHKHGITITGFPPSVFNTLVPQLTTDDELRQKFKSLRTVIVGGEEITPATTHTFINHFPEIRVVNLYGPTEASIGCIAYQVTGKESSKIPIGKPIANAHVLILDSQRNLVPIGVPGEIYLSGICLGLGYLNDQAKTKAAFVDNPFQEIGYHKLYKTGDLARYLPDGNIEFLGRIDHQVKIRGFRIELGEIEIALAQHPEVREAVVSVREDQPGNRRLVAYVVANQEALTTSEIRRFLKEKLPEYMVPSAFVILEEMPLTPNGKVNRRALPVPDEARPELEETFVAPRDTWELQLTQIWEEILDVRPVGVRDNFFNLGGHSLLSVRLMAQIQKRFGQNLPLSTLFQSPTIEHLASILRQQTVSIDHSPLVGIQTAGNQQPFFCVHPAGGNVLCYGDLARHLGTDRPFYGLQALDVDEQQIDRMASHYIEAIRTIQPEGPYLLGGWSMGGVVAFEMAQQLQKQGQKVAQLILLDSTATAANVKPTDEDHLSLLASFAQDIGLSWENQNFSLDKFRQLKLDQQLAFMHEQAKKANLLSPDVELPQFRQLFNVFQTNVRAMWNYVPQAYSGRIVLFKASDRFRESSQDPTMGWGQLVSEGVEMQMIPGNHYTIVRKPHVQVLAEKLRVYLNLNSTFPSSSRLLPNLKNIEQCTTTEM